MQQAVALLPWSHNLLLMSYDLSPEYVVFYVNEIVAKGWSRDMLRHALKSEYHLSIQATDTFNNFDSTLPAQQVEYTNEVIVSAKRYHHSGVSGTITILLNQMKVSLNFEFHYVYTTFIYHFSVPLLFVLLYLS